MISQSPSLPPDRPERDPSRLGTNAREQMHDYAQADGDVVNVLVDPGALLENLVDVLAEHPALLRHLNGAVFASVQYDAVTARNPEDGIEKFRQSRLRERAGNVTALATSDEMRACLTHVLVEDQATDLALELDHAIRQVRVDEYDPFERDQTYKED